MEGVCFCGQREVPPEEAPLVEEETARLVARLAEQGTDWFLTGGAPGFETLAARAVLRVRRECPGLRLALILPCQGQTWGWREEEKAAYRELLARADSRLCLARSYYPGCLQRQGRWMVDHSRLCICRPGPGQPRGYPGQTVAYARQRGVPVLLLNRSPAWALRPCTA